MRAIRREKEWFIKKQIGEIAGPGTTNSFEMKELKDETGCHGKGARLAEA